MTSAEQAAVADQKPRAPCSAGRRDAAQVEREHVAAARPTPQSATALIDQRHDRDAIGAQHERGDRLGRIGDVEQRDPGEQRQRRCDDHRVGRVEADDLLAQQVDTVPPAAATTHADLDAVPADAPRVGPVAGADALRDQRARRVRDRQRHHEHQRRPC